MAITGTFAADFSAFSTAVDSADAKLKGFEDDANKVGASLSRMATSLSGTKMLQDATLMAEAVERIGGVTKLTEAELQRLGAQAQEAVAKMRAMGIDVPDKLQQVATASREAAAGTSAWSEALGLAGSALALLGIGTSIQWAVGFGREIVADASNLENLALKTDLTTKTLQEMRLAGDRVGVGLESMVAGATRLSAKLGADDPNVVGALRDLGIEVTHFQTLNAAQQFDELSKAVNGMHDPLRLADDLSKIFGKNWVDLVPVLKKGFKEVGDDSATMSTETVKYLDAIGNTGSEVANYFKVVFGEAIVSSLGAGTAEARRLKSALEDLPKVADPIKNMWGAIVPPGLPKDLKAIEDGFAKDAEQIEKNVAAMKKFDDAMVEINSVGQGWAGTLATIDGNVVEGIKYYLQAGVAQDKLAAAYGLTAAQIKAVDSSLKAQLATEQILADFDSRSHELAMKRSNEDLAAAEKKLQARNALVIAEGLAQKQLEAGAAAQESALDRLNAKLAALDAQQQQGIATTARATQAQNEYAKSLYDEAVAADAAAAAAIKKGNAEAEAARQTQAAAAAAQAAADASRVYSAGSAGKDAGLGTARDSYGNLYYIQPGMDVAPGSDASMGGTKTLPSLPRTTASLSFRATGGPVQGGSPYVVGEKGPELYVPTEAGTIIPNNIVQTFSNTFNLTDTADALARKVADLLMRSVMTTRKLPAS